MAIVTPSGVQQVLYENEKKEEFDTLIARLMKENKGLKINQYTLCLVQYPASMLSALKQAVADQEISSLDRIQLLLDMKRLCNAQRVKPSDLLSFMEAYKQENDWSVLEFEVSLLNSLYEDVDESLKVPYQEYTRQLLYHGYEVCGWDPIEGENVYETSARPLILG